MWVEGNIKCFWFVDVSLKTFTCRGGCSTRILLKVYPATYALCIKKLEKSACPLFQVILEDSFSGHQGNDLYDPDKANYRIFRVKKSATLQDFLEQVAESLVGSYVTVDLCKVTDSLLLVCYM